MNEERPVLEVKVQGKKGRGRPQKTWNKARKIAKERTK